MLREGKHVFSKRLLKANSLTATLFLNVRYWSTALIDFSAL